MKDKLLSSFINYVSLNILGMLALSCYILADTYFIANGIGSNGLASLNLAISVYSIIHGIGLMLGIGGAIRYNMQKSGKNKQHGNQTFTATVSLGLLIGFIFSCIGMTNSQPLAKLLGANKDTLTMTATYLKTILCFSPCFILNNILIAFIRNDGNPKVAMIGMFTGSLSNVLLDYIFIFPLGMGMFGAAFATGLAPIISIMVMSPYFIRKKNQFHLQKSKSDYRLWPNICSLGASAFVSEIASGVVLIVFNLLLLGLSGNIAVAAYGVIANLSFIGISVFTGIGQGMQPLVSHYYSAGKSSSVRRLLHYGIILSCILATLLYGTVLLFSGDIVNLFNSDKDELLKSIATNGLHIYFVGFFFAGVNVILSAYLSATQRAKTGFFISILRGFIVVVPLAMIFSAIWNINGIWLTFPITEAIVFVVGAIKINVMSD